MSLLFTRSTSFIIRSTILVHSTRAESTSAKKVKSSSSSSPSAKKKATEIPPKKRTSAAKNEAPPVKKENILLSEIPSASVFTPASKTRAPTESKMSGEELLMSLPNRSVVNTLRKGFVTEPKPHWIPIPKRLGSPYLNFFKDFTSTTAKEWKELPEEKKKKYEELAAQDLKRYEEEVQQYFKNRTWDQFYQQKLPAQLIKLDPLKPPKLPAGPYAIFVSEFGKEHKAEVKGLQALSRLAGAKWKSLSEVEKKVYSDKAAELKEEFEREWKKYQKKLPAKPVIMI